MDQTELETLQGVKERIDVSITRIVSVALILALLGGVLLVITLALNHRQPPDLRQIRMVTAAALCVSAGTSWLLMKRWGAKPALILFCALAYVMVTALSIRTGTGVASPSTAVSITLIVIAGFMVSPKAGLWTTAASTTGAACMVLAQQAGWISGLTPKNMPPPTTYAIAYVVAFAMMGTMTYRFSQMFWRAIDEIERARQALAAKVQQQLAAEVKLKDSERRLTALLDNTPMAVLIFDIHDGHLRYANQHALKAHQADSVADLEANGLCSEYPYSRINLLKAIQRAKTQGPHERQWRTFNKQGVEMWWSVKLDLIELEGEQHVAGFATNISQQIKTQQALIDEQFRLEEEVRERTAELMEQQRQLNAIIDALPVALSIKDTSGHYCMSNRVFEQLAGHSKSDILGMADSDLFDRPTAYALSHDDHSVLSDKHSTRIEQDIPAHDGTVKDYLVTKVPLLNGEGETQALLTLATDISDIKALQRELRAAKTEAERLAKVKSEFLANMSHEIRTPLNGVLGLAQMGARDYKNTSDVYALFSKINRSGRLLLGVINDILDFSKIDAGKLHIESTCLSPAQVAEESAGVLAERAVSKGLMLHIVNQGVPAWVMGDSLRIQQILVNLLSNAVKFTEKGSVTLTLSQDNGQLLYAVQDTGIGMSPKVISRVFSPFEQADTSTTRQFGGTGLGLSISRQLARLMGGDITVSSTQGQGSTFVLSLPVVLADQAPAPTHKMAPAQEVRHPLEGLRVLAADDVDINREILQSLLEHEGAQAQCAVHGQDALDQVRQHGPGYFDVVLMDVQMPIMDGLTATQKIHQIDPGLPVIALTAHAMQEERQRCLDAGMQGHLIKPIETMQMAAEILSKARRQPTPDGTPRAGMPTPSRLPALTGVDLDTALSRCGGKEAILIKLLKKFADTQHDFAQRFGELVPTDMDSARRAAHSLKGTAANLGFADIAAVAARLEQACTQNALADIPALQQETAAQLCASLGALNEWLQQREEQASIAYNVA